jgi:hypothetical protein
MDWVKARLGCSLEHAWIALREQVIADIETWQRLQPNLAGGVRMQNESEDILLVSRIDMFGGASRWIRLAKFDQAILLKRKDTHDVNLAPTLNAKGECRLLLADRELEFWQVSRMALEPMLF